MRELPMESSRHATQKTVSPFADSLGGPLAGILVADFSRVLAGPLATMTLADLGARVIKVEKPGTGDDTRSWGPPVSETGSTYFDSVNRNKESVCLDLGNDADKALALELASRADVVIENFKPGGMAKLGLGYDDVVALNPGVVYVSISGFGSADGADLPGYDFMVQAVGGLMSITGEAEGLPTKAGVAVVDVLTAKDATIGILAALFARHASGQGTHLEVNLLSSLQGALVNQVQAYVGAGVVPHRMGNAHPSIAPYELLGCADVPLAVACGNDGQFAKLVQVLAIPSVASDEQFVTNSARVRNRPALVAVLEERLRTNTAQHWQSLLTVAGVPAGKVGTIEDGIHLAESLGLAPTIEVVRPDGSAAARQVRHPITWQPSFPTPRQAPPLLGQHTESVKRWLTGNSHT
jgi:crotonobetainyl-CoA:carnitine CoA-transferase CaiB-like acyl-CoA transferase